MEGQEADLTYFPGRTTENELSHLRQQRGADHGKMFAQRSVIGNRRTDGRTRTAEGDSADERPLRIDAVGYWPSKLGSDCLKAAFYDSTSASKSAFIMKLSRHH